MESSSLTLILLDSWQDPCHNWFYFRRIYIKKRNIIGIVFNADFLYPRESVSRLQLIIFN